MTNTVPPPPGLVPDDDIYEWYRVNERLSQLKEEENRRRRAVFEAHFPNPVEGTNTYPLPNKFALKGKHPINRKVLEPDLAAMKEKLIESAIPVDKLVRFKPELVLSEYNTLTAEQKVLFDQVLEVNPGMPGLEIVQVKRG